MADEKYQVHFYGEIKPGADIESVKNNLAQLFKVDKSKIGGLFSGKKKVVKKDATREVCEKTRQVFEAAGAVVAVVPQESREAPVFPPAGIKPEPESEAKPEPEVQPEPAIARAAVDSLPPTSGKAAENMPDGRASTGHVNRTTLVLLTFFLGGFGIHKFYLGRYIQGILSVLFSWTLIPALISMFEILIYAVTSEEKLNSKYKAGSTPLVIITAVFGPLFFMVITGILIAIAIPLLMASYQEDLVPRIMDLMNQLPAVTTKAIASSHDYDISTCRGKIKGLDFSVQQALLENGVLHLSQDDNLSTDREMIIFLFPDKKDLSNQQIVVSEDNEKFSDPQIHLKWKTGDNRPFQSDVILKGYDLTLAFGQVTGNTVQGKIDLYIPGGKATRLAGTFTAEVADK